MVIVYIYIYLFADAIQFSPSYNNHICYFFFLELCYASFGELNVTALLTVLLFSDILGVAVASRRGWKVQKF
jgi:hypothetical protein